jgi:hypothetical protein
MADNGKVFMNALSAIDAISPTIERTKRYLFHPLQWGPYLKICAVGLFTEGFSANFNSSTHGPAPHGANGLPSFTFTPILIAEIAAAAALAIVVALFLFYLVTRLRFALFHCLIHQTKEITPGWRLYREAANRFFKLSLVIGLIFVACIAAFSLPFVLKFIAIFRAVRSGQHINFFELFSLILPLVLLVLALVLIAIAIDIVLRDFMLPRFALEDASAREAWRQVRNLLAAEPGSFFVFALLRVFLPVVAFIALLIVLAIPALIVFGALAFIFAAFHGMSTDGSGVFAILGIFFEICVGLIGFCLAIFAVIALGGPISIGLRNYTLLFYGGRYKALGDILNPPLPPADISATI